jgi:cysteine-rich repeat protein
VAGSEECDDGNTTDGDGCSAGCVTEICGNGVVQAGEECDDGNASNADACRAASCGDGFVRDCGGAPGADCGGCAGHEMCFRGTFTLDDAAAGPFEPLRGVEIEYVIAFDVASTRTVDIGLQDGREVTTGPVHVEMSGHP